MASQVTNETPNMPRATRIMSVVVFIACLVVVVMVAHHPVATGNSQAEKILTLHELSGVDQIVHGAAMFGMALLTSAMMYFSSLLGFRRPAVLTAAIFYILATTLMFVATTIDGFAMPMIGARCAMATSNCLQSTHNMLSLASIFVQSFTRIGEFATAIAIMFWSIELLHLRTSTKVIGVAGAALAVAHLILLFSTASILTPHSLLMLLVLQVIWYLAIAVLMSGWFQLRMIPREG